VRPLSNSLLLPTVIAIGIHALAGCWWLTRPTPTITRAGAAMHVSLLTVEPSFRSPGSETAAERPDMPAESRPRPEPRSPSPPVARERVASPAVNVAPTEPRTSRGIGESTAPATNGSRWLEAIQPPYLPGEPLIDLRDQGGAALDGQVELHLSIDETGHVVDHRVASNEGLPDEVVQTLQRAFSSYVYVPARRSGVAVASEVTMMIRVREGRAASTDAN
jgi:hypothetical protein